MRNGLFLFLSLFMGWALTLLLDISPVWRKQLPTGLVIVAFIALVVTAFAARSTMQNRAQGHPAEDLLRQGRAFRAWFVGHALFWLLSLAILMLLCVHVFYWQIWVVALVAGLATAWSACMLGLLWPLRAPLLSLCWQHQDRSLLRHLWLPLRYRATLAADLNRAKPKTPYLMAILEQGTVTGMARYARLQPKHLPWRTELRNWLRSNSLITAASALLALILLVAVGGLGYLINTPLQLPGLQASEQAARMNNANDAQASQQAKADPSAADDSQQDGEQADQQNAGGQDASAASNGDSSESSDGGSASSNGQGDAAQSGDSKSGNEGGEDGSNSGQSSNGQPNGNDSQSGQQGNQNGQQSGTEGGQGQAGEGGQQGSGQQPGSGQDQADGGGEQGSGQQSGQASDQAQGSSSGGDGQGNQGQDSANDGSGAGSGGSGEGASKGGGKPKLGQREAISMPPPGVGKVVTIEAPETEDPNAEAREGDLESLKASDEPPTALDSRGEKQSQTDGEAEVQEGRSLQYLPNWIRHIKKEKKKQ